MAKLSETATTILSSAAAHDAYRVLPLPKLKAPPVIIQKTLKSLLANGLVVEIPASRNDEVWAQSEQHGRITLAVTAAGLAAIGIKADTSPTSAAKGATRGRKPGRGARVAKSMSRTRVAASGDRKESKQNAVIALLRRANGASIDEMMEATGWQAHSVRGFMSGALKKRLGLEVVSEKNRKTGERRYHMAAIRTPTSE